MIELTTRQVALGKPRDWPTFGWDNEYGHEQRDVSSFKASKRLISNGEFYEFVSSGAYLQENTGVNKAGPGDVSAIPAGPHSGFRMDRLVHTSTGSGQRSVWFRCSGTGLPLSTITRPKLTVCGDQSAMASKHLIGCCVKKNMWRCVISISRHWLNGNRATLLRFCMTRS